MRWKLACLNFGPSTNEYCHLATESRRVISDPTELGSVMADDAKLELQGDINEDSSFNHHTVQLDERMATQA